MKTKIITNIVINQSIPDLSWPWWF